MYTPDGLPDPDTAAARRTVACGEAREVLSDEPLLNPIELEVLTPLRAAKTDIGARRGCIPSLTVEELVAALRRNFKRAFEGWDLVKASPRAATPRGLVKVGCKKALQLQGRLVLLALHLEVVPGVAA